jgi:hypothetical protein
VVEYPAFSPGVPVGVPREQRAGSGDRKLAQSAQMYHYQHQKQQMIAAERLVQPTGRVDKKLRSIISINVSA